MNNRWTIQEESKLLKLLATGKTCKELSGGFNRSENALVLRVKKIIYENITNGKEPERIAVLLNYPKDKVMQYYYSYKDYIGKQQGGNINNISDNINKSNNQNTNDKFNKLDQLNQTNQTNQLNQTNHESNQINTKMKGGDKVFSLENQNKHMKLIIENYILKQKLAKLLKTKNNDLYKESIKTLLG
jgi:hypothetical protein